ncbi:hypothetical protein [Tenacibaculum jejuense]|uniref:Competence protein n=1 Tax=Tenacibaculum jejuense TaxID=584609 RepID=A0A238U7H2_9FLAO|nr:hypothetical protein [Tenacibaculum jejuense]SNR14956.1 conserved protein of unknown function [Tenacibaculum jejuense]
MSVFESLDTTSEKAVDKAEEFLKYSKKYYELKIFQILTSSISLIFRFAIVGVFLLISLIFMAAFASSAIGSYFNNDTLGYITVALIFILFAFLGYLTKDLIENKVIQSLSKKYFDDEEIL